MIKIPRDRLEVRFARAGGPGGQNVNRVETKAEIRFVVGDADWIPGPIRGRLKRIAGNRLNDRGELIVSSTRFRSQGQNLEDCLRKLAALIEAASHRPTPRVATRPTRSSRERRWCAKRAHSAKKGMRRWRSGDSGD